MELVENLCRLCFEQGNIQIFDDNGRSLEIATIIKQHLDCEVSDAYISSQNKVFQRTKTIVG